jgi:hypothetical protein
VALASALAEGAPIRTLASGWLVRTVQFAAMNMPINSGNSSYRRGRAARQGLKESRSETAESRRETAAVSKDRDDLIEQRDTARAYTASDLGNGTPGQRSAAGQATATLPESPAGQPAPDVSAGARALADDAPKVSQP